MSFLRLACTCEETCEPFGPSTQVSTQVQLASTYVWSRLYFSDDTTLKPPLSRHTTPPEKFVNATLFLQLGLPTTLSRHENGAFRKPFSNRRDLKTSALCDIVDGKYFENTVKSRDFPDRVSLKHKYPN